VHCAYELILLSVCIWANFVVHLYMSFFCYPSTYRLTLLSTSLMIYFYWPPPAKLILLFVCTWANLFSFSILAYYVVFYVRDYCVSICAWADCVVRCAWADCVVHLHVSCLFCCRCAWAYIHFDVRLPLSFFTVHSCITLSCWPSAFINLCILLFY
jgi:hypothetical protein